MRAIRPVRHALVLAGTLVVSLSLSPAAEEQGARLFALKVFPLLKKKCFACHGEDPGKVEGKLNLLTREGMLRGGEKLLGHIEKRLGIKVGESTSDGKFHLKKEEECLAACTGAPMMMVDHKYYENLTPAGMDEILDAFE